MYVKERGIFVIWDLVYVVGNVELRFYEWGVDVVVWCLYKYLNGGLGCIGGMFVYENNSVVMKFIIDERLEEGYNYWLVGWWGNDKKSWFGMENRFYFVKGVVGF